MNDLMVMSETDALIEAFNQTKIGCDWKASVQKFESDLLINIVKLQAELRSETYEQQPFREFDINERGKLRHIKAVSIKDRVVQRSLCDNVLIPELRKYWIYDNGASVKGKGISFSRKRMRVHLERYYRTYGTEGYILQIDFKNFFGSIPQEKVLKMIYSKLQDKSTYELTKQILNSFSEDGIGLGIGSQLSQVCGIFYPTYIDNFCKIKRQCKFYGRYMDDMYILSPNKQFLRELLEEIRIIAKVLGLTINENKTHIVKLSHGFIFLKHKYFLTNSGKIIETLSRDTITRERRKLKKYKKLLEQGKMTYKDVENSYKSWEGSNSTINSYNSTKRMRKLFEELFDTYKYQSIS